MKLKFVMVAAMLAASFGASAKNYAFPDLDPTGDQEGGVSSSILANHSFDDTWSFVLDVPSSTSVGAQQSFTVKGGGITGFTGELFSGSVSGSHSDLGALAYTQTLDPATLKPVQQNLSWAGNLGSGNYYIEVSGFATTKTTYSTTIAISPVPEPETYGMLLVGLGLLGFTARRKSNPKLG